MSDLKKSQRESTTDVSFDLAESSRSMIIKTAAYSQRQINLFAVRNVGLSPLPFFEFPFLLHLYGIDLFDLNIIFIIVINLNIL